MMIMTMITDDIGDDGDDDGVVASTATARALVGVGSPAGADRTTGTEERLHAEAETRTAPLSAIARLHAAHYRVGWGGMKLSGIR